MCLTAKKKKQLLKERKINIILDQMVRELFDEILI
jgi:hypothetical protein